MVGLEEVDLGGVTIPESGKLCQSARSRYHSSNDPDSLSNSAGLTNNLSDHVDKNAKMSSRRRACRHCWSKSDLARYCAGGRPTDRGEGIPKPIGSIAISFISAVDGVLGLSPGLDMELIFGAGPRWVLSNTCTGMFYLYKFGGKLRFF